MTTIPPTFQVGLATDIGWVRDHNEDAARVEGSVFVVADGMGGHAAGEVASRIAADAVAELASRPSLHVRDIVEQVGEANRRILSSAARHPAQTGMGTTLAGLAMVTGGGQHHWAVFNIGDSRVYRMLDGHLSQVTADHSEVWSLVERGLLTADEATRFPGSNIITRSLGREPMGQVDTWVFPPYPGEVFVLCSDGLSNEVTLTEIEQVISDNSDPEQAAAVLVERALKAGGRDNVTVIVVSVQGQEASSDVDEDTTPRENMSRGAGQ